MNFSQLRCFIALADMGSFTEAAYTVNLTQSAVSHALSALESELGMKLLERNRKGVVALTTVGRSIIPHVRELLAQAEAIEQEAKAARGEAAGKLRLGSIDSIVSPGLLASVLTCFRATYPDIEVVLFEGTMQEVGEWIASSIIDVGFVLHPVREKEVESTLITTDELCVLVSSGHRLHAKGTVIPRDLRDEGFIMAKTRCTLQFLEIAGFEAGRAGPTIRYQASDSATIFAMVREGLGITLVPRMALPKKLEGIVALPFDPPHSIKIGLALRSQETASPGARLFVQTALAWVRDQASLLSRTR